VASRSGSSTSGKLPRNDAGGVDLLSVLAISKAEARRLGPAVLVERLVDYGTSRLTAERFAAFELGTAEPGRARPHSKARH
jgi:hypothetical protein